MTKTKKDDEFEELRKKRSELIDLVNEYERRIRRHKKGAMEDTRSQGLALIALKATFPRGEWKAFVLGCNNGLGVGYRQIARRMRWARRTADVVVFDEQDWVEWLKVEGHVDVVDAEHDDSVDDDEEEAKEKLDQRPEPETGY